jgi:hypothetical protein
MPSKERWLPLHVADGASTFAQASIIMDVVRQPSQRREKSIRAGEANDSSCGRILTRSSICYASKSSVLKEQTKIFRCKVRNAFKTIFAFHTILIPDVQCGFTT